MGAIESAISCHGCGSRRPSRTPENGLPLDWLQPAAPSHSQWRIVPTAPDRGAHGHDRFLAALAAARHWQPDGRRDTSRPQGAVSQRRPGPALESPAMLSAAPRSTAGGPGHTRLAMLPPLHAGPATW